VKLAACPISFRQTLDAANQDVRPKSTYVTAECGNGPIGRDEQRKHVEPFRSVVRLEPCVVAASGAHQRRGLVALPREAVHERLAVRRKGPAGAKQAMLTPRRAKSLRSTDVYDTIARDA